MVGFARYKIQIVIKNHTRVVHTEREVKIEFYVDKIRAFMDERGMQWALTSVFVLSTYNQKIFVTLMFMNEL